MIANGSASERGPKSLLQDFLRESF